MNPSSFLGGALVAAAVVCSAAVPASAVPASAAKTPPVVANTPVARLLVVGSLPEPVAVVNVVEDVDGDGVAEPVPASPTPVAPAVNPNGWRCPVPAAKFTNDWGRSRSGGRSHTGTDMLSPQGTPIFAPLAGVVKFDSSSRGGLSFYLDALGGVRLYGAHMSAYGTAGSVESGTIIGYVGDTGNAKGTPHLHLEVHPTKKTKTNPYPLLKQIC